jgi:hypothetical protein
LIYIQILDADAHVSALLDQTPLHVAAKKHKKKIISFIRVFTNEMGRDSSKKNPFLHSLKKNEMGT